MDFAGTQRMPAARVNTPDPEILPVCRSRVQSTVLMSHSNGLRCDIKVIVAAGMAIRDAALEMGIPIVLLTANRECNGQGNPAVNGHGHG